MRSSGHHDLTWIKLMVIYLPLPKCFIFRAEGVASVDIHRVDMYILKKWS